MQTLNKNIDIDVRRFFLWWGKELAFLLPEKLKTFFSDKNQRGIIIVSENSYEISLFNGDNTVFLAELERNEKGKAAFLKLLENDIELKNTHFIVRLSSKYAIKKAIYLPETAIKNLYQVVLFEFDRYTPFKPEQVYFSVKQLGQEESGLIKALLILTPKEEMDYIHQELKSWQIEPKIVDFEDEPNDLHARNCSYNLLRDVLRVKGIQAQYILPSVLALVTVLLIIAVLILPVYWESQTVDLLKAQLKPLTKESLWVEAQQAEIDSIYDRTVQLIDKKKNTRSVIELINILTTLINDQTWLTHLQIKSGKLQIQGQSPAASTLIGVLEASSLFNNVRFVSPLTQDKKTGLERFQISAEISQAKVPVDE